MDRETVVQAAADIADSEGFHSLTLARLAEVLHRHVSSLYNHVEGLEGLRREVAAVGGRELSEAVTTAAVGRAGTDALTSIAHAYRTYMREHPGRYFALTLTPAAGTEEGSRTVQIMHAVFKSFGLSEVQTVHAHRIFTSAIRGFVLVEHSRGFSASPDPDGTFDQLIRLFASSLISKSWPLEDEVLSDDGESQTSRSARLSPPSSTPH